MTPGIEGGRGRSCRSHCEVKTLPRPSLVQLSCEDTDPSFVQGMLAYLAEGGTRVFRRVEQIRPRRRYVSSKGG